MRCTHAKPRPSRREILMSRLIPFLFGMIVYLVLFATILYAIGFVENLLVPKAIDSGPATPVLEALIVNLVLMAIFAVQHSLMARKQFKAWWKQFVPEPIERSTYVLFATLPL